LINTILSFFNCLLSNSLLSSGMAHATVAVVPEPPDIDGGPSSAPASEDIIDNVSDVEIAEQQVGDQVKNKGGGRRRRCEPRISLLILIVSDN
jgi:hypothetical protein